MSKFGTQSVNNYKKWLLTSLREINAKGINSGPPGGWTLLIGQGLMKYNKGRTDTASPAYSLTKLGNLCLNSLEEELEGINKGSTNVLFDYIEHI